MMVSLLVFLSKFVPPQFQIPMSDVVIKGWESLLKDVA